MAEKNIADIRIRKIKGNVNTGDVFNTINNYQSTKRKIQFETLTTAVDAFSEFPRPRFTDQLIDQAKKEQLVLLGGNGGFDKGQLLRYMAISLKFDGLEVKECSDFTDFHSLSGAIQEETGRCIFVLYNLTAESINFRWQDFKALTRKKDHIILSSTETTYDAWRFQSDNVEPGWFQVPDTDLYAKETLLKYLEAALTRKNLTLSIKPEFVVEKLTAIEQLDIFVDLVAKSDRKDYPAEMQRLMEISMIEDQGDFNAWYYGLPEFQKLIVLGITLFDGAYEGQVFAGFDRILQASWKHRNHQLRSIDYEDIIPLKSYIKTEGRIIQGKLEHQRKKIIRLAWNTHRRYILSALPVLMDIASASANKDEFDLDLFQSTNHRSRIRRIISDTLSDIALHSFEDGNQPLLLLASKDNALVQTVTAMAISNWRSIDAESEKRMYEVLDLWQEDTADGLLTADKEEEVQRRLLSNVRGAIALSLFFASAYDQPNTLSSGITDLLLKFLHNNETAIINRMQFTVDNITDRHPVSMQYHLRNHFLQYDYYIRPAAYGLVKACNNGQYEAVRNILEDWLKYHKSLPDTPGGKDAFGHKECVLTAIILTLQYLDYDAEQQAYSIENAHKLLEELRKNNHNLYIRQYLLDAIIKLAQEMHAGKEHRSIETIVNLDAKEREAVVQIFRSNYLEQREELEGGDYRVLLEEKWMDGWKEPGKRPVTKVEALIKTWEDKDVVLRQIALQTLSQLKGIEDEEKKIFDSFQKQQEKENKWNAEQQKLLANSDNSRYDGEIRSDVESKAFMKICRPYVPDVMLVKIEDMYKVALHDKISEARARDLISSIGEQQPEIIPRVMFIYKLFTQQKDFRSADNPATRNFQSAILILFGAPGVGKKALLREFAPLLMAAPDLESEEKRVVLKKIDPHKLGQLQRASFLAKNPLVLIPVIIVLLYILFKIIFLFS
jgi:hypothetical protein